MEQLKAAQDEVLRLDARMKHDYGWAAIALTR